VVRKASFTNEYKIKLRREVSSALWLRIVRFLFYTTRSTLRSNKFPLASFFVYFMFGMIYLGYSLTHSILPSNILIFFWISIAFSDFFLKYHMSGMFMEYVGPLLQITLLKNLASKYVLFNLLFYYHNIAVFSSFFLGIAVKSIVFMLAIFVLNHMIVLLFKMDHGYNQSRMMIVFVVFMAILNLICILFLQSLGLIIFFIFITLFMFNKFLNCTFYVK
jgi:hypothetical protein